MLQILEIPRKHLTQHDSLEKAKPSPFCFSKLKNQTPDVVTGIWSVGENRFFSFWSGFAVW